MCKITYRILNDISSYDTKYGFVISVSSVKNKHIIAYINILRFFNKFRVQASSNDELLHILDIMLQICKKKLCIIKMTLWGAVECECLAIDLLGVLGMCMDRCGLLARGEELEAGSCGSGGKR